MQICIYFFKKKAIYFFKKAQPDNKLSSEICLI